MLGGHGSQLSPSSMQVVGVGRAPADPQHHQSQYVKGGEIV